jgi:hypothetical protein
MKCYGFIRYELASKKYGNWVLASIFKKKSIKKELKGL